jgi:adenosylcobinamide amidohydrolase
MACMMTTLTKHTSLNHSPNHIHIEFSTPHRVLSSAVLNGGLTQADHIVNMKVAKSVVCTSSPQQTILSYCEDANWNGVTVGMMTAASMDSFRMVKESEQGIDIVVLVTSGLSNPRRVGDRAEHRVMAAESEDVGTINVIVLTSAILTEAAMVEALLIITEAKSAALQDAKVLSPVSNTIATGTGTDSAAIVSGQGPETVGYCGKHVLFGEMLGRMVTEAVSASIAWDIEARQRIAQA